MLIGITTISSLILLIITCLVFPGFSLDSDTINSTAILKDSQAIVSSPKGTFKLGFFNPKNTTNRFLGVFYAVSPETVVWVANPNNPLKDDSGTVSISRDGNLVLRDGRNKTLWSTNVTAASRPSPTSAVARIHDTGNLVLLESSAGNTTWESFSEPSHLFLPTMKIVDNVVTGEKVFVSSWVNDSSDPKFGDFKSGLEALDIPQMFTWKNGEPHWRSGPWNGQILIGVQDMYSPYLDGFKVVNDPKGHYYFTAPEGNFLMNIGLNSSGTLLQTLWNDRSKQWDITWLAPQNECDVYGVCGPFGTCNSRKKPICSCMRGFEPANRDEWDKGNWTNGCKRRRELVCDSKGKDKFLRMEFVKVPDFAEPFFAREIDDCRAKCLANCSCLAYAFDVNIRCMFWTKSLIDVQEFNGVGTDLYVRLVASELGNHTNKLVIVIPAVLAGFVSVSALILIAWCLKHNREEKTSKDKPKSETGNSFISEATTSVVIINPTEEANVEDLPLFTFETLAKATDGFSENNLVGKGGFGSVYRGNLENGEKVAVKRLSVASGQGIKEFMNEVILISKLQHRNLVRLLGCCIESEEKMLVYEYMPNRSLDVCLFDDATNQLRKMLDWAKRFSIIEGIGRGLLYLHRDSRLRIIHRDLKPSNVLLDEDWNPKISDFGMARIFGGDQDHANTARVVRTYGYMAPEYAMEGRLSEKSDVFRFGVLMLEIIKGQKNTHYYNHDLSLSLLGCAWKLWRENRGTSFADDVLSSSDISEDEEIVRCKNIALLCVQEFLKDRLGIQTVLSMLSREIVELPKPEKPVFAEKWNEMNLPSSSYPLSTHSAYSVNELTITVMDGR